MKIEITLNTTNYAIIVEGNCFTAIKYGINESDGENKGKITSKDLGYFNKLSNACLRLCREEIASSDDVVDLKEFASRIEAINAELLAQLEGVQI
jgi:hypothetical protein